MQQLSGAIFSVITHKSVRTETQTGAAAGIFVIKPLFLFCFAHRRMRCLKFGFAELEIFSLLLLFQVSIGLPGHGALKCA